MLSKVLRGVFGQPRDLPPQFMGKPFEILDSLSHWEGIEVVNRSKEVRELVFQGKVVSVKEDSAKGYLIFESITDRKSIEIGINEEFDAYFSLVKLEDGHVYLQKKLLCWYNGDPSEVIKSAISHIRMSIFRLEAINKPVHFRPYLNGRTFWDSWRAFYYFMKEVKRDRITSEGDNYVSFDTGGIPLGLQKSQNSQEVFLSYDLRDFEEIYGSHREKILELVNQIALRHREICFQITEERLLMSNMFYVSPETDAVNLYTVQLQAIHDAFLDYFTTTQEAEESAWLREARKKHLRKS